jgi:hypothetical protein
MALLAAMGLLDYAPWGLPMRAATMALPLTMRKNNIVSCGWRPPQTFKVWQMYFQTAKLFSVVVNEFYGFGFSGSARDAITKMLW